MSSQLWWYVARSGGVVAWALATASVVWGLLLSSRLLGERISLPKLLDLHRVLGGLSVVFVVPHLLGLYLDEKVAFGPSDLFVPLASKWQPGAVAWGIIALYVLVAVEATSLLRRRIGERVWRFAHYGGFAVFLFGTIHGLRAGTDAENPLIWWPAAIASAAIVGLCVYRIFAGDPVRVAPTTEQVPVSVLERTLSELERLDTDAYPPATPVVAPLAAAPVAGAPQPEPVSPGPMFPDPVVPGASLPAGPPVPTRSRGDHDGPRPLPVRAPRRVPATTAPAASLASWRPATAPEAEHATGPPPPPDAVDPATGEPDPSAYRKWLREWLAYVESQP